MKSLKDVSAADLISLEVMEYAFIWIVSHQLNRPRLEQG